MARIEITDLLTPIPEFEFIWEYTGDGHDYEGVLRPDIPKVTYFKLYKLSDEFRSIYRDLSLYEIHLTANSSITYNQNGAYRSPGMNFAGFFQVGDWADVDDWYAMPEGGAGTGLFTAIDSWGVWLELVGGGAGWVYSIQIGGESGAFPGSSYRYNYMPSYSNAQSFILSAYPGVTVQEIDAMPLIILIPFTSVSNFGPFPPMTLEMMQAGFSFSTFKVFYNEGGVECPAVWQDYRGTQEIC